MDVDHRKEIRVLSLQCEGYLLLTIKKVCGEEE